LELLFFLIKLQNTIFMDMPFSFYLLLDFTTISYDYEVSNLSISRAQGKLKIPISLLLRSSSLRMVEVLMDLASFQWSKPSDMVNLFCVFIASFWTYKIICNNPLIHSNAAVDVPLKHPVAYTSATSLSPIKGFHQSLFYSSRASYWYSVRNGWCDDCRVQTYDDLRWKPPF